MRARLCSCRRFVLAAYIAFAITLAPLYGTELQTHVQHTRPGGLGPAESLASMQVADDLAIDQVLAEPTMRQPVFLNFDERGRMWVVQYAQYPHPAGLKIVSRDNFWRNVYDSVPPPPPHAANSPFRGADKISIHEDSDGDGTFDRHKTFLEGLSMCTSVARGRGGVWVLNPPYLLFYADKNNDDVPDSDPVVHLKGFGLEDSHSIANSLRWGPDGWLYGAQGSTVTANIVRPGIEGDEPVYSQGQLIWRYHPETRRFEIFAEGGGNAFGCEIDSKGRVFSGHNGGATRGYHYVQGGYLRKGFDKHGALSNPYAFDYFRHMRNQPEDAERFSHTFLIYEARSLPDRFHRQLLGVEPIQGRIVLSEFRPRGATFETKDVDRPVTSTDSWFRPVDIKLGPDGAVYIADWYDGQVNHYRNHEGQIDPSNGRVYRLRSRKTGSIAPFDLAGKTSTTLVDLLKHDNRWYRQTALRLIADRNDQTLLPLLREQVEKNTGQFALECLWALHLCGGLDETETLKGIAHTDPYVRLWTIRLACDDGAVSPAVAKALVQQAQTESHVEVRGQLACSARRVPAAVALPILRSLLAVDQDADDPYQPLLVWWAIEKHCKKHANDLLSVLLQDRDLWERRLVQHPLLENLMRRFAMEGKNEDLRICAALLDLAPDKVHRDILMSGFEKAFAGRSLGSLPVELLDAIGRAGGGSLLLRVRRGDDKATIEALAKIASDQTAMKERTSLIAAFGEISCPPCVPVLLEIAKDSKDRQLLLAALAALQRYEDPEIVQAVLARLGDLEPSPRRVAESLLSSRQSSTLQLLQAVDNGTVSPSDISLETINQMRLWQDTAIQSLLAKHFLVDVESAARLDDMIKRYADIITAANGSPYNGQLMFRETCAKCHTLFSQGGQVGPDLTTYKRDDLASMLLHVVNPSAEIREGYEGRIAFTEDGRVVNGLLIEQDNRIVVLRGHDGTNVTLSKDTIDEIVIQKKSLMPDGLLDKFSDQQLRDLFAYLRSTQPLAN